MVDLEDKVFSFPPRKVKSIIEQCQSLLSREQVSVRKTSQLIGEHFYSADDPEVLEFLWLVIGRLSQDSKEEFP